ncbi:MAG: hydroxylamine oxidoreductase, partial [Deltaproteobacteria bacterium]|nr:hydroxylamine oxidoreductase [Deltaproteobacteria bacterium]
MRYPVLTTVAAFAVAVGGALPVTGAPIFYNQLSAESQKCVECHQESTPVLDQQWGESRHHRGNVGCYECHGVNTDATNALDHNGFKIHVIVTPKDCSRCHERPYAEMENSHHAKAGEILGSLDNVLANVVEGNKKFYGKSALAVNGCLQCHGSEVRLKDGEPTVDTWPNDGIGRLNVDGSRGSCSSCHMRHTFSVAQARQPETCGRCHLGPDHPQKEIYETSRHGILYAANKDKMNMDSSKWVVGVDYWAAPTCATCHMSATKELPSTHDVGARISWNNRPSVSVRPEVTDAKLGLTDKPDWKQRRAAMKDVCQACHNEKYVSAFYEQYDGLIQLYNEKFGEPGEKLYGLLKEGGLITAQPFDEKIDWTWFLIWHHQGRQARHGASMMQPDYTHWHGLFEVAEVFYSEYIPEARELVAAGLKAG